MVPAVRADSEVLLEALGIKDLTAPGTFVENVRRHIPAIVTF